jgi:hypothetical protein
MVWETPREVGTLRLGSLLEICWYHTEERRVCFLYPELLQGPPACLPQSQLPHYFFFVFFVLVFFSIFSFFFFLVLGTKLRALHLPGKRSSTELNPQPLAQSQGPAVL